MRAFKLASVFISAVVVSGLSVMQSAAQDAGAVNLYSSRHYDTDLALYDEFTEKTGIKVNRLEAGADALIERIKSEGEFSPADVLITVDAGRLVRAEEAGLLASISSEVLEDRLPAHLRHPEGLWFSLSKRARVIIYNKAAGRPEKLDTYADLADPANEGKVCIRSSSNIYNISLLASIIAHEGAESAEGWAAGVVANFARNPQGNDTSQIRSVATGECAVAVVNSYYLARFASSDDPALQSVYDAVGIIFPDQEGRGTHINISGAGVLNYAPNRENAIRFIEYLTEEAAQQYFANGNNEYPVVDDVAPSSAVEALGAFVEDDLNVAELGANQALAVEIFDRVGWP
ncbi:MAG: Fe(3+) ABC transporter substrate-binding protein [Pseudomonadota bacterium]